MPKRRGRTNSGPALLERNRAGMKPHNNLNGNDFHGTCIVTGKRQYASRNHARKARQIHSHTRGAPYRCEYCGYFHIGRYKKQKTRDGYRGESHALVKIESLAQQLGISPETVRLALHGLNVTITDDRAPLETLDQLRALTYRKL